MTRDDLINELMGFQKKFPGLKTQRDIVGAVVDFILARQREIVEPLIKHLKDKEDWNETKNCHDCMRQTLRNAGVEL